MANAGILGIHPLRLGPDIRVDDGAVDVVFMRGQSRTSFILAGLHLLGGRYDGDLLDSYKARSSVLIETEPRTMIKADGEFIGYTPLELEVLPAAVKVIVPCKG